MFSPGFAGTTCPSIHDLSVSSNLNLKQVSMEGVTVHCDLSTETPRPLVPQPSRRRIFESYHNIAHPGVRAIHRLSFCLARFVQRHKDMDQVVFGLPKREGKPPHQDTGTTNSCTCPAFQSHPRRPSGSLALFLWFHTPFHNHRLVELQ